MDAIGEETLELTLMSGPGTIEILILCIVGIFAARLVFFRGRKRVAVLVPVGIAGVLIGGPVFGNLFGNRSVVRSRESVDLLAARVRTAAAVDSRPGQPQPIQINVDGYSDANVDDAADASSLRIEQTDHGNMLVLPLSASILETYLGPEGTAALESLSNAVPPEFRQAYALVPIPGAMGDAVPGLHALATTIAHLTQAASTDPAKAGAADGPEDSETPLAEAPAAERPAWIDQPPDGQIVVRGEFQETQKLAQAQLANEITRVLVAEATEALGAAESGVVPVRLTLSDDAVAVSIRDRFAEEVPLTLGTGPKRMFRTSALVEFPEGIRTKAERHVQHSLQQQRAWTVGVTAVSLGLLVMLAAGLMHLAGRSSRFVRWTGVPLVTLLMLPAVAVSSRLIHRVVVNENPVEVPSPFQLPDTVIGVESDVEIPANASEIRSDTDPEDLQVLSSRSFPPSSWQHQSG